LRIIDFEDHVAQELARASLIPQRRWLRWSTLILAALLGLGLLVTLVEHRLWWLALALGALTLLSGAGLAYYGGLYRKQNRLRGQLQAGLKGQRLLTTVLACLDDSYYLINNLKLPGRADDVDHLLVGPNGIFALETKHHRGRIFCHNGQWYQSKMSRGGHLQPDEPIRDPVQQLKRNVDYLRTCINHTDRTLSKRTGLWIEGAVVFTHPAASVDLPEHIASTLPFPVLKIRELPAHIAGHVPRRPHTKSEIREIVSLLGHLHPPKGPWTNGNRGETGGQDLSNI
jgi:hypothetical protein